MNSETSQAKVEDRVRVERCGGNNRCHERREGEVTAIPRDGGFDVLFSDGQRCRATCVTVLSSPSPATASAKDGPCTHVDPKYGFVCGRPRDYELHQHICCGGHPYTRSAARPNTAQEPAPVPAPPPEDGPCAYRTTGDEDAVGFVCGVLPTDHADFSHAYVPPSVETDTHGASQFGVFVGGPDREASLREKEPDRNACHGMGHEYSRPPRRRRIEPAVVSEAEAPAEPFDAHLTARVIGLLRAIADPAEDPNADAADGVTVLDVWRKEAEALLAMTTRGHFGAEDAEPSSRTSRGRVRFAVDEIRERGDCNE
jgi:hypothetical protein